VTVANSPLVMTAGLDLHMDLYDEVFWIHAWDMRNRVAKLTGTRIARMVTSLLYRGHSFARRLWSVFSFAAPQIVASDWKTIWETVCSIFTALGWRF
jgi:hypothetical protein